MDGGAWTVSAELREDTTVQLVASHVLGTKPRVVITFDLQAAQNAPGLYDSGDASVATCELCPLVVRYDKAGKTVRIDSPDSAHAALWFEVTGFA